MPAPIRVVLSDLDDTLFDHRRATRSALAQAVLGEPALAEVPFDELDERHRALLDRLHLDVLAGRRTIDEARVERFRQLLVSASATEPYERAIAIARTYRSAYAEHMYPVSGALELAEMLRHERLRLVIVTNNIVAEQRTKLDRIGLAPWIDALITSEEVGVSKPGAGIFEAALAAADASPAEAVMLGDAWPTDIAGGLAAGVRVVWLNRFDEASPDPSVPELRTLEPARAALDVLRGWL
jgi:putative hydrolase of the HAD superfamily